MAAQKASGARDKNICMGDPDHAALDESCVEEVAYQPLRRPLA